MEAKIRLAAIGLMTLATVSCTKTSVLGHNLCSITIGQCKTACEQNNKGDKDATTKCMLTCTPNVCEEGPAKESYLRNNRASEETLPAN